MQTLPNIGDQATIAGFPFPLTVDSFSEATRTAALSGEHPETGLEVVLPRVCLSLLLPADAAPVYAIGQSAVLKSGGPLMTVSDIEPPLPFSPEGTQPIITCQYFTDSNELGTLKIDVRGLTFPKL